MFGYLGNQVIVNPVEALNSVIRLLPQFFDVGYTGAVESDRIAALHIRHF